MSLKNFYSPLFYLIFTILCSLIPSFGISQFGKISLSNRRFMVISKQFLKASLFLIQPFLITKFDCTMISFEQNDSWPKVFLLKTHHLLNSTTELTWMFFFPMFSQAWTFPRTNRTCSPLRKRMYPFVIFLQVNGSGFTSGKGFHTFLTSKPLSIVFVEVMAI